MLRTERDFNIGFIIYKCAWYNLRYPETVVFSDDSEFPEEGRNAAKHISPDPETLFLLPNFSILDWNSGRVGILL